VKISFKKIIGLSKNKAFPAFLVFSLSIIYLFVASPAKGEEVSLEQALNIFYKNNYDLLINRYEIDKAYGDFVGAKLLHNPNLSINYIGLNTGLSASDNTQTIFRLDQLIELGGKRGYRINAAAENYEAAKLSHQDIIRSLLAGFYTNYHNLLLNELNVAFALEELKRFDRVIEIGEKRHQTGFLSLIDYTKLKLARVELENSLTTISNQFKNDLEIFNLLLGGQGGLKPLRSEVKEDFPEYGENLLLETAYANRYDLLSLQRQTAYANRYDLLSLQRQIKSAEYNQKLAKAQRIPDITLGGEYETYGPKAEPGIGAGISLNIPLFSRGQGEFLKRSAELNQLKVQIEKTKKQIQADIRQGLNNYGSSLKMFNAYKTRKEEMDTLLGSSEKAFSLGGITVLELLDTHKTYRDFITKYNQSLIQSSLNKTLIKVYSGEIK